MRKIFSLLLLSALLFSPLPASAGERLTDEPADNMVDAALEIFTLTVTLVGMETREGGVPLLTVKPPEGEAAVIPAAGHCRFIDDRKQPLSPSDFARRYRGKKVTIDFTEHGPDLYVVEECRSGSK
ncbi:MAG: hypothetical protein LBQ90_08110 [Synergistaceae bacterium]|jgi:hypothetical protein|nr:hypothetical protein [Synergistaceae bacterium]